jgi:PII-like signaling protein
VISLPATTRHIEEHALRLESGPAMRLTIFVKADDRWHHRPLYTEIVHRAHKHGLAGASVFRGVEGFGKSEMIHTSRILDLSDDLPCSVIIVDIEDRIRDFLPQLDELVTEGLVLLDPVEVVKYASRELDGRR